MDIIMTELKAKSVVKDKFWIVEEGEKKIATIQAIEEGGFVYVHDDHREKFPTVNLLKKKLNIAFDKATVRKAKAAVNTTDVYGFPSGFKNYNCLYDVSRKLPIFTKSAKSKSYFCAGHYAIKFNNTWTKAFCPKLITLQRYEFIGPYCTKEELAEELKNHGE